MSISHVYGTELLLSMCFISNPEGYLWPVHRFAAASLCLAFSFSPHQSLHEALWAITTSVPCVFNEHQPTEVYIEHLLQLRLGTVEGDL